MRRTVFLAAIICMLPLVWCWPQFRELYWFHDDWHLMNQWDSAGLAWIWQPTGEHFNPLFKILWMAAVRGFGGSYTAMILLVWATHFAVLVLFGLLLVRCGFGSSAAALAVITLGLPWTNIETLGWATQWSALLCTLFLMIAWVAFTVKSNGMKWAGLAASIASGLTFMRGGLSGVVVGTFVLSSARRWAMVLAGSSGFLFAVYVRFLSPSGRFANMSGKFLEMAVWGFRYELLNPLYHFVSFRTRGIGAWSLIVFGVVKIAVMFAGIRLANREQRQVLWSFVVLELGTAALLTPARYDTGDIGVVSYRYQYVSLMCFAPFLALLVARSRFLCVFAVMWLVLLGWPWKRHMEVWSYQRGVQVRKALAETPDDRRFGLPEITAGRARELIGKYGLH